MLPFFLIDSFLNAAGLTPLIDNYFLQELADQVNTLKTFPRDKPNGKDLGDDTVYFSDRFGAYDHGRSGIQYVPSYLLNKAVGLNLSLN